MKKYIFIGLMFIGANIGLSYGQVVIGGGKTYPVEGALLDLKQEQSKGGVTASKGFLMPRVMLTDINKLTPLVKEETDENKEEHIGLQVYHVGGGTSVISSGLKIWNGTQWDEIFSSPKGQWIYMPPFPIKMYEATEQKINLYDEYKKQLETIKSGVPLWKQEEVDFVIIGYDNLAFDKVEIKTESNAQMLTYKAALGKFTAASYLNIIIVKK